MLVSYLHANTTPKPAPLLARLLYPFCLLFILTGCDTATEEPEPEPPSVPTFSRVFVEGFRLLDLPFSDPSGSGWDESSGPDLFITVFDARDEQVASVDDFIFDVGPSDLPVSWDVQIELDPERDYRFVVFDQDETNAVPILASNPIRLSSAVTTEGAPASISITGEDADLRVELRWIE